MKFHKFFPIILVLFLFSACSTANVKMDFDRNIDFDQFQTFNFYDNIIWGETSSLDQRRILNAIEIELIAKGMSKSEHPDLLIDIKTEEKLIKRNTGNVGIGSGSFGRRGGVGISVGIPVSSKKLNKYYMLEMVDSKSNNLVWQAIFEKDISPNADQDKHISEAINKLLSKYPPQ